MNANGLLARGRGHRDRRSDDHPARLPVWGLGALCAMLPDLDVVAFALALPYGHVLGHRGLSHSLPFAAGLALVATAVAARRRLTSRRPP